MKNQKLTLYIFLGLVFGVIVGWQFPEIGKQMNHLAQMFLNMIKMIIAPLLFSVIVTGIASHGNSAKEIGKLGAKTFIYFACATTFALIICLTVGFIAQPGAGFATNLVSSNMLDTVSVMADQNLHDSSSSILVNIVPTSIIKAMADGNL